MAQYNGFYPDSNIWSDYRNRGFYASNDRFRSLGFDARVDLVDGVPAIKLKAAETYEIPVISEKSTNKITCGLSCDTVNKAMVEIVEGGIVVDSYTNSQALTYPDKEDVVLYSSSTHFIVRFRFRVLPLTVGKVAIARFSSLAITPDGMTEAYALDEIMDKVVIRSISGGSGSTVWVKINGVWKQANVNII